MTGAIIHVQRKRSIAPIFWNVGALAVVIDGKKRKRISEDKVAVIPVEPGRHVLTVRTTYLSRNIESDPLEVSLQSGEQVQLYCEFRRSGRSEIVRVWREGDQVSGETVTRDTHAQVPPPVHRPPGMEGWDGADGGNRRINLVPGRARRTAQEPFARLRETHKSEEAVGIEYRNIENPSTRSTVTRTIRVTHEWTRSYTVDIDHMRRVGGELSAGITLAGIKANAENEVRKTYHLTATKREEFTDEVVLHIEPASRVRLQLEWKKVWQHGIVEIGNTAGELIQVPYRIVASVTFDQRTVDM
jgi:hypothetical protein